MLHSPNTRKSGRCYTRINKIKFGKESIIDHNGIKKNEQKIIIVIVNAQQSNA